MGPDIISVTILNGFLKILQHKMHIEIKYVFKFYKQTKKIVNAFKF